MILRYTAQTSRGYEDCEQEIAGPFYHGGRARLRPGDALTTGRRTNSWGDEGPVSAYVHFTDDMACAAVYAQQCRGRLYEVEPTGEARPGYGSGEFKSAHPLRVVREIPRADWPA
jgi:hypothetical protein